jgi:AcrR family transcriptional regulator
MSPRAGLDKEQVVQAAAELLNAEGPAALSLNRLAKRLGVQTPSLYNHVDGLPGLQRELALLNVRGLGEHLEQAAIGRSGAEALRAIAKAYREYIKASPGVYMASLQASGNRDEASPDLEEAEGRVVAVGLAVVASFGLGDADGLHAVRALRSMVHGFASLEVAGGFGLPLDLDESFRRLVEILVIGLQQETRQQDAGRQAADRKRAGQRGGSSPGEDRLMGLD